MKQNIKLAIQLMETPDFLYRLVPNFRLTALEIALKELLLNYDSDRDRHLLIDALHEMGYAQHPTRKFHGAYGEPVWNKTGEE